MTKHPKHVREPVQVYLDRHDQELLERLVAQSSMSKAELLRLGLRRLSEDILAERRRGAGLDALTKVLDASQEEVPRDLASRHDEYLYGRSGKRGPRRD